MEKSKETTTSFVEREEQWPPGFRFHPTDEELILYYLKRKICRRPLKLDVISDIDVYKADPDELPGLSRLKTGDRQWFFFSPRDRKYPNGGRSNRATRLGYWKATGKDRTITCNSRIVGIKKTLVFYKGRAPSGERTDWVMHEYTLDEEELKRCPAQDYYALYKVFKKSGPGPKNGEQYGAPFREEDWADDDQAIVSVNVEQAPPLQQCVQQAYVDNNRTVCEAPVQINSLDEFLNDIANDPLFQPLSVDFSNVLAAGGDEQTRSTVVDESLVELNVQERGIVIPPFGQFNHVQCVNLAQSASYQLQATSEVTFATNMRRQGSHESEEFFQDFLELNDLISPELINENNGGHVEDFRIEDFDGLCELDLFQDVSMFLQEVGDTEQASHADNNNDGARMCNPSPVLCPNHLENSEVDQVPNSYNNIQSEMVQAISQPYYNSLGDGMVNQFNYQMPELIDVASELGMQNQNFSISTPAVSSQGSVIPPTSGVVYTGVNQIQNHNLNQNTKANEGGGSWFSSTLWSFVENIPTTPASAAESTALVNKAFERLSSFRRGESVKVSLLVASANASNPTAPVQRSQNKCNRGFFLFSVVGVLCAVLWVFSETLVR